MPARPIAYVLKNDLTDRTPQDVINANPPGTFVNNSSSNVPPHLYQSLKTIWAPGDTTLDYQKLIIADLGTGQTNSAGSIVIASDRTMEQVLDYQSFRSDVTGAEIAAVCVYLYKPRTQTSIDQILNASLRIRYLIDNNTRQQQTSLNNPVPASLPQASILTDLTINPNQGLFCFYQQSPEPQAASETVLLFAADYVRYFTK